MVNETENTNSSAAQVVRGDKIWEFNPETMTNRQYEVVETHLIESGFNEQVEKMHTALRAPEYVLPFSIITPEGKALLAETDPKDESDFAKNARDYQARINSRADLIREHYQKANALLLKYGRSKLVAALLVPQGEKYSRFTSDLAERELIPDLTREEVEKVLSSFLPSRMLAGNPFPVYLNTKLLGEQKSQPETQTAPAEN